MSIHEYRSVELACRTKKCLGPKKRTDALDAALQNDPDGFQGHDRCLGGARPTRGLAEQAADGPAPFRRAIVWRSDANHTLQGGELVAPLAC
jgi:hypothetical protein